MQPRQPGLPKMPLGVSYTVAVLCAFVIAASGYFVIRKPLTAWRQSVTQRAESVRLKLADGPTLRRRHAEREQELEDLLARVELVNLRIPDQAREGEFLADLSQIATKHHVTIDDFRRGETTETATHSLVSISIRAEGPYRGLCGLVEAIAQLPRLAELTQLKLTSDTNDNEYPIELTYALYYGMATPPPAKTVATR